MNTDAIQQALHDSAGVVKLSTHVQRSALWRCPKSARSWRDPLRDFVQILCSNRSYCIIAQGIPAHCTWQQFLANVHMLCETSGTFRYPARLPPRRDRHRSDLWAETRHLAVNIFSELGKMTYVPTYGHTPCMITLATSTWLQKCHHAINVGLPRYTAYTGWRWSVRNGGEASEPARPQNGTLRRETQDSRFHEWRMDLQL